MRNPPAKHHRSAFTLVELLVVIAVIVILAGLILPAVSRAKEASRKTNCLGNLRQVNLAIHHYAEDNDDSLPVLPSPNIYPNGVGAYYKELVKTYLGLSGPPTPTEKVFICPADQRIYKDLNHAFTSYTFNGYEVGTGALPRITGKKVSAIRNPSKAVMVGEWSAFSGGSWHPFKQEAYVDAPNLLAFVDGHVALTKIYWDGVPGSRPANYEPTPRHAYSWSGE